MDGLSVASIVHDLAGRSGCNDEIESNGERRHENIKERPLTCTRDVQEGTRACGRAVSTLDQGTDWFS